MKIKIHCSHVVAAYQQAMVLHNAVKLKEAWAARWAGRNGSNPGKTAWLRGNSLLIPDCFGHRHRDYKGFGFTVPLAK
jgi:hypothetical protein